MRAALAQMVAVRYGNPKVTSLGEGFTFRSAPRLFIVLLQLGIKRRNAYARDYCCLYC